MLAEIVKAILEIFRPKQNISAPVIIQKSTYLNRDVNRKAFLKMIRWSEGTAQIPNSDEGYRALVGGGTFQSYAAHPNQKVWIKRIGKYSDAAGAYQILYDKWVPYIVKLSLKDFSPPYQDIWALNALREVNALDDIDAGRFSSAVVKAGKRWASLPGSPYGQVIRSFAEIKDAYSNAGGQFAA